MSDLSLVRGWYARTIASFLEIDAKTSLGISKSLQTKVIDGTAHLTEDQVSTIRTKMGELPAPLLLDIFTDNWESVLGKTLAHYESAQSALAENLKHRKRTLKAIRAKK